MLTREETARMAQTLTGSMDAFKQVGDALRALSFLTDAPEYRRATQGRHIVQAALKQGRVHTRRRLWCGTCGRYRGWMDAVQDCPECAAFWRRAARDGSISGMPRLDDVGLCLSATEEQ